MLAAEMVAETKAAGMTLRQRLEGLFAKYGCHAEKTISVYKRGETGMEEMLAVMVGVVATSCGGVEKLCVPTDFGKKSKQRLMTLFVR